MKRAPILLLVMALGLMASGCGDDVLGDDVTTSVAATEAPASTLPPTTATQPPPTTAAPDTTTAPPTTGAPTTTAAPATTAATTTTAPPAVTYEVDDANLFPDPLPGSNDAHGSGCVVPGGSMTLTDGIWFGFVEAFTPGMLTFDLACFWTGDAAAAAALEDGEEDFGFYIRNQNPTNRQVPLSGSSRIWYLDASAELILIEISPNQWPHPSSFLMCPGEYCSVWLYVNGGEATALVEQYLP